MMRYIVLSFVFVLCSIMPVAARTGQDSGATPAPTATSATPTATKTATPTQTSTQTPTPTITATPDTGGIGGACAAKLILSTALNGFSGGRGTTEVIATTGATAGLYACTLIQAPCSGSFTKLACPVVTGLASTEGECGIFSSDGATRIASTGAKSTAASAAISTTGLSPFTITSGVTYLLCWANSATATVTYRAPGTPTAFNNQYVNTTFNSGAGATQVAPFNAACTASTTPYTCCTGVGTGTCLGMVDRTGVQGIVAASVMGPTLVVAP